MYIDHVSVAGLIALVMNKNKDIASVTPAQEVGTRNPKAIFTIIGENGAVLQVEIKRLMRGQESEVPAPKPKAKASAKGSSKRGAK